MLRNLKEEKSKLQMKVKVKLKSLSRVRLFATPWSVAYQAPLSMGFSRHEYRSGLPFPPPEDLPDPGIETVSFTSPVLAGRFFITEPPEKPQILLYSLPKAEGKYSRH